jgi:hypothetical protein
LMLIRTTGRLAPFERWGGYHVPIGDSNRKYRPADRSSRKFSTSLVQEKPTSIWLGLGFTRYRNTIWDLKMEGGSIMIQRDGSPWSFFPRFWGDSMRRLVLKKRRRIVHISDLLWRTKEEGSWIKTL